MNVLYIFVNNHGLGQLGDYYQQATRQQILDHPAVQKELAWRDRKILEAEAYTREVEGSRVWVARCLVKVALDTIRDFRDTRSWRER